MESLSEARAGLRHGQIGVFWFVRTGGDTVQLLKQVGLQPVVDGSNGHSVSACPV